MKPEVDICEVQPHELMVGLIDVIRETEKKVGYYQMKDMASAHLSKTTVPLIEKRSKQLTAVEVTSLAAKLYNQLMMRGTIQALSMLSEYQADAKKMTPTEFLREDHSSGRLARHMRASGVTRPKNVAAHAIVSGTHGGAEMARQILARHKIRIDDPANGVYLPRDERFMPHEKLPDAANHAKLHTPTYYLNVTRLLQITKSPIECRMALKLIAKKLIDGSLGY